jgi:hypothetical protein
MESQSLSAREETQACLVGETWFQPCNETGPAWLILLNSCFDGGNKSRRDTVILVFSLRRACREYLLKFKLTKGERKRVSNVNNSRNLLLSIY